MIPAQLSTLRHLLVLVLGSLLLVVGLLWGLQSPQLVDVVYAASSHAPVAPTTSPVLLFKATLSGAHQPTAVISSTTGYAIFALNAEQSALSYRVVTTAPLSVTAAQLYISPTTENSVSQPLTIGVESTISGTLTLTPKQVAQLIAGYHYLRLQISQPISGVVQGQIVSFTPPLHYRAELNGASQVPTVTTAALGVGYFTRVYSTVFAYSIAISRITTITAAHIHQGPLGRNGPPVHTLYTGTGVFTANHPLTGSVALDAAEMVDLLTGYSYVNLHTVAHPAGEVRGQILEHRVFQQLFLPFAQAEPAPGSRYFFNIVVVSRCERQPAGNWFEGTTSVQGVPDNGHLVAFSYAADGPIVAKILSGPHQGYPGWKTGYYSHIISAHGTRAGTWYVWIVDDRDQRISEIGSWQSTGPGEGCNQAVVDFDSRH